MKNRSILEYKKHIVRFFSRNINTIEDIEDLTQEVLFILTNEQQKFSKIKNMNAWIYGICRNKLYDFYKAKNKKAELLKHYENERKLYHTPSLVNKNTINIEKLKQMLNKKENHVFDAYYVEKYKISEISELFDIPEGTVKFVLFKIRKIIREKIL